MSETRDVVIIGSGCSGHTAALYTARANLKPLVIEGHEPGGQLSLTTLVENMRKQAERFGAEYRMAHLTSVDLSQRPFLLHIGVHQVHAQTLIIASGASARWLGLIATCTRLMLPNMARPRSPPQSGPTRARMIGNAP